MSKKLPFNFSKFIFISSFINPFLGLAAFETIHDLISLLCNDYFYCQVNTDPIVDSVQ